MKSDKHRPLLILLMGIALTACGTYRPPGDPSSWALTNTPALDWTGQPARITPDTAQPLGMAAAFAAGLPSPAANHNASTPTPFLPSPVVAERVEDEPPLSEDGLADGTLSPLQATPVTTPPRPVPPPPPTATPGPRILFPDLKTLPPYDLRLVFSPSTGQRIVRFSNAISNIGPGILELIGRPDRASGQIQVVQQLYAPEGTLAGEHVVGEFVFHSQHNHWHLEEFALYEVWSTTEEMELDALIATGRKISYCVLDIQQAEDGPSNPDYPRFASYTNCNSETQGLSPGWIDVYKRHLPGQWVDITDIPDGIYALVSSVNPDKQVLELIPHNNTGVTFFELKDSRLELVELTPERELIYDFE